MLRCSTFGCDEHPFKHCNKCESVLLCEKCIPIHLDKHKEENSICTFDEIKIKLSTNSFARLRNNIKKSICQIEIQKNKIKREALKIDCQIQLIVKSAFKQLDNLIEKYKEIYKKTEFGVREYEKIQDIIKESLDFENPSFSKVKGSLTKNKTNQIKRVTKQYIKNLYCLQLEGHTSYVNSVTITSDNQYVVSGSLDKTVRVWNLLEKRQEVVLEGHTSGVISVAITSDNQFVIRL
ncbi:hypothetical protein SteCoe_39847 [Stentor coeruleus]|uniref:Uncharacterized protein n=1 Tax=Stentor coeruleus TaxID=5963 RepID=A0A1R2AKG0_9CILI|nr:hypothetical protein SteCoe_39847 [Stentor coeruleus]